MFTGIIQEIGRIGSITGSDEGASLVVESPILSDMKVGDSIAVNGVCLTAVAIGDGSVNVDVVSETLARTALSDLAAGDAVNLERPMRADGRFDGHIVQGHVDGVGTVSAIEPDGVGSVRMTVEVSPDLMRYIVQKGSITVDGISLTVAAVVDDGFQVAVIPHTLEVTNLGTRQVGQQVNLEVDVLAKYVERLMKN